MTTADETTTLFVPGSYWTPDRQRESLEAMLRRWETPEIQTMKALPADELHFSWKSGSADGSIAVPKSAADVTWRRGRPDDVPGVVDLVMHGELPPLFIEEWVAGFAIAEFQGDMLACGGLEMYGEYGVIRSVVTHEAARKLSLGRALSGLLVEDARLSGAREVYLFTQQAWPFWLKLGYEDVPIDEWPAATQPCWQWRWVRDHWDEFRAAGVHSMRIAIAPRI